MPTDLAELQAEQRQLRDAYDVAQTEVRSCIREKSRALHRLAGAATIPAAQAALAGAIAIRDELGARLDAVSLALNRAEDRDDVVSTYRQPARAVTA